MAKINDIRFLARETAKEVSGSPRDGMGYLDTASRLYRYPFSDTLLIHAQRPDATACAELEVWNEQMRRWVNRGAKGIALIDDTGPRGRQDAVPVASEKRTAGNASEPSGGYLRVKRGGCF